LRRKLFLPVFWFNISDVCFLYTITPRTFNFSHEQLSHLQNQMDIGMQTSPINNFIDKTVQTISNSNSVGIQANPPLTIDTMNLSPGFEK
jgi:hypothetical protein